MTLHVFLLLALMHDYDFNAVIYWDDVELKWMNFVNLFCLIGFSGNV